ncbi:MAG: transglycosylase SLT domain-containing protein [Psychrilyobacter sp.]|nr:transglycosylase SLT domain-containing protein [Psychrilyobacter sp.]
MKKIILLYLFVFSILFSYEPIDNYRAFIHAKNLYLKKDYENAKIEFENYIKTYGDSKLAKSNYPNYFIGMTYYELGELRSSLKFLDSSIYTPKYLQFTGSKKTNLFEFERGFYLGEIYSRLGKVESANNQYSSLIKGYYSLTSDEYEKKALNILTSTDPYYKYIMESKYQRNYTHLDNLKDSDLQMVGRYLYSKGLFIEFYNVYKNTIFSKFKSKTIVTDILNILEEGKEYNLMIELISKQAENNDSDYYFYGNALKKLNKPMEAIEKYKKVGEGPYLSDAVYSIGRIYFILEDYESSILWAKKLSTDSGHELLTRSYFQSKQMDLFKKSAITYIQKYPNSNLAGYYRNLLYNESKNPNYLNWIIKHNLNSYYYQVAYNITKTTRTLEEYPISYKNRIYKDEIALLEELSTLGDPELLTIETNSISFPNDKIFEYYLKTIYAEKNQLYTLALKSALRVEIEFSRYSNLYPHLYPRYYNGFVAKYSTKNEVEEAIIYSLIREQSLFDSDLIFKSTYFGLMQISLKTAKLYDENITYKKLLDPETNIRIGTLHLKYLLNKYNGNITLAMSAFSQGEDVIANWRLDANGDIDVEKIPYLNSQYTVKNVITNYYKYKKLYSK